MKTNTAAEHRCRTVCPVALILLIAGLAWQPATNAQIKRNFEQAIDKPVASSTISATPAGWFRAGIAYQFGQGVTADTTKALAYYERAANAGHAGAQFNLGYLLHDLGQHQQAVTWIRRAAEQGLAAAQRGLALLYAQGLGVPKDPRASYRWCRLAAMQGLRDAQYDLGVAFDLGVGVSQDPAAAAKWFAAAARQGHANAQYNLGIMYEYGEGIEQDFARAVFWYEAAARQGHPEAQLNLGTALVNGQGVDRDLAQAWFWFEQAGAAGLAEARHNIELIESVMPPNEIVRAGNLSRNVTGQ